MSITQKILIIVLCLLTSGCVIKHLEEHFKGPQGPYIRGLDHLIVEESPEWLTVTYYVYVREDIVEGYAKLYIIDVNTGEPIYSGITQPFEINTAADETTITLQGLFEIDKRGEVLIEVFAKNRKGKTQTRRYQFYVENTL